MRMTPAAVNAVGSRVAGTHRVGLVTQPEVALAGAAAAAMGCDTVMRCAVAAGVTAVASPPRWGGGIQARWVEVRRGGWWRTVRTRRPSRNRQSPGIATGCAQGAERHGLPRHYVPQHPPPTLPTRAAGLPLLRSPVSPHAEPEKVGAAGRQGAVAAQRRGAGATENGAGCVHRAQLRAPSLLGTGPTRVTRRPPRLPVPSASRSATPSPNGACRCGDLARAAGLRYGSAHRSWSTAMRDLCRAVRPTRRAQPGARRPLRPARHAAALDHRSSSHSAAANPHTPSRRPPPLGALPPIPMHPPRAPSPRRDARCPGRAAAQCTSGATTPGVNGRIDAAAPVAG